MGQVAHRALRRIVDEGGVPVGEDCYIPVAIGLGRDRDKLATYAREEPLASCHVDVLEALEAAKQVNPSLHVYHNAVSTGVRRKCLDSVLPLLDPATTAVFCEKPIAANYEDGRHIVEALERGRFLHGVVHDMLETPGLRKALQWLPLIKPLHCNMVFGYEVGPGTSDNVEYRGQRPDFNWLLDEAGGGIVLDMCHEAYVSYALFGATTRLSAVARLLVPRRQ